MTATTIIISMRVKPRSSGKPISDWIHIAVRLAIEQGVYHPATYALDNRPVTVDKMTGYIEAAWRSADFAKWYFTLTELARRTGLTGMCQLER